MVSYNFIYVVKSLFAFANLKPNQNVNVQYLGCRIILHRFLCFNAISYMLR